MKGIINLKPCKFMLTHLSRKIQKKSLSFKKIDALNSNTSKGFNLILIFVFETRFELKSPIDQELSRYARYILNITLKILSVDHSRRPDIY